MSHGGFPETCIISSKIWGYCKIFRLGDSAGLSDALVLWQLTAEEFLALNHS
jgi:hypothetical protein